MRRLISQTLSPAFSTVSLRPDAAPMGHVLNIDHFHMSAPTFPPHPHAGFSAVTWMMPWSPGGFVNRDSLGDRSAIGPGALHWTRAGAGMMHEEVPAVPGVDCEGLQIFVKLPEAEELAAPRAFHLDDPPSVVDGKTEARVLVGALDGVRSPMPADGGTTLIHASVRGPWQLAVPDGVDAFALVLRGAGRLGGEQVVAHDATSLRPGTLSVDGDALEVLIGWSARMPSRPQFRGPFCMFTEARLIDAIGRYRAGGMGQLA